MEPFPAGSRTDVKRADASRARARATIAAGQRAGTRTGWWAWNGALVFPLVFNDETMGQRNEKDSMARETQDNRIAKTAAEVWETTANEAGELAFISRVLVQA